MSRNSGFTLIEVLIVVAISAMLAALAIGYSGVERDQAALSVEETKISQFILQARALALATYGNTAGTACGYGVSFNPSQRTYSVFAYVPGGECPSVSDITSAPGAATEARYTDETWEVHPQDDITLPASAPDTLSLILFYPPDPTTFLFGASGDPMSQASIYLESADGKSSRTISVNSAGQVSF
jgi:prepilin-type N-terminal cleavage/methylation domain-containing protein